MKVLATRIMEHGNGLPEGTPVVAKELLHLGSRAAVDQATDQDAELPNRTTYGADVSPALARADRPARVTGTVTVLTGGKLLQVFPVP